MWYVITAIDSYSTPRLHDTHPNETSRLPLACFTHSIIIINIACHVEMRSDFVELAIEWGD